MELYFPFKCKSDTKETLPAVLIVGLGLIGGSIKRYLTENNKYQIIIKSPIKWSSPDNHRFSINKILPYSFEQIKNNPNLPKKIIVIWSAGKAGFSSTNEQIQLELMMFKFFCNEIIKFKKLFNEIDFLLFSSAGGLFEGQTNIHSLSELSIKRPYGLLKIQQENYLDSLPEISRKFSIRPSSVFGEISNRQRMGLIPTMLINGLTYKVTNIFGYYHTLRDFVWVEDIAKFVCMLINSSEYLNNSCLNKIILASGKPSSIYEIKNKIEIILKRKLYIAFKIPDNERDITYQKPINIHGWIPTPESECIKKIYHKWTKNCL